MNKDNNYSHTSLPEPIPITEQHWPEGTLPLVTTRTITYMHEPFIRECIEGILMQKTTFPVEVVIHDDASTDKTADIVREYQAKHPRLIKTICQKENQFSKPGKGTMREDISKLLHGKYIALCEGDDYWTDPLKLQKQVDIFEKYPDTVICGGRAKTWNETTKEFTHITPKLDKENTCLTPEEFFYWGDWVKTCTRIVPTKFMKSIPKDFSSDFRHVHFLLAKNPKMKLRFLEEEVAIYREHPGGIFTGEDPLTKKRNYFKSVSKIATLYNGQRRSIMQRNAVNTAKFLLKSYKLNPHERLHYFLFLVKFDIESYKIRGFKDLLVLFKKSFRNLKFLFAVKLFR
jgi:glycosyltransferase involved in cell wall biosynthesis